MSDNWAGDGQERLLARVREYVLQGDVVGHILHTPMEETYRKIHGKRRWCFTCREKQWFEYVVQVPVCVTGDETGCWYGPSRSVECSVCHTTDGDYFPGTQREWADD